MTDPSFEDTRKRATLVRKSSRSIRKEWNERERSDDRDRAFVGVVEEFDDVIRSLEKWRGSAFDREAVREIGDCLGAKGGTLRDWGRYDKAAEAYDHGLDCERSVEMLGGQPNSYCLVQRLVMRVLWQPEAFHRMEKILDIDVHLALKSSGKIVHDQMKALRKGDPWAQADFALVLQLLGEQATDLFGDDDAITAWDKLDDLKPDRFVRKSTCDVVKLVQNRLAPFLREEEKDAWGCVVSRLS